ncbi:Tn3 family transposase [Cereibacter sphaeroides]|nr:Tn3 family transposase [Cereibacter sphaeroides]MCE6967462.1 Tn3 family transposase [Cereibacter sphaeroides]
MPEGRAQIGLNKGEAHHALKRAISFHRRGEIRDRTHEGLHYRIAGLQPGQANTSSAASSSSLLSAIEASVRRSRAA